MNYALKNNIYILVSSDVVDIPASDRLWKLEHVESLTNFLGFEQKNDVQTGDVRDYIITQSIEKSTMSLKLFFKTTFKDGEEYSCYSKMHDFMSWIARYSNTENFTMTFIVSVGNGTGAYDEVFDGDINSESATNYGLRFDFYPSSVRPDGLSKAATCSLDISMKALTAWYSYMNMVTFTKGEDDGSSYNYTYSKQYSGKIIQSDPIYNDYLKTIPIKVSLKVNSGKLIDPTITLRASSGTLPYSTVMFEGLNINAGETLVIDSDNFQVYLVDSDNNRSNKIDYIDKSHQTFIWAQPGGSIIGLSGSSGSSDDWVGTIEYKEYKVC